MHIAHGTAQNTITSLSPSLCFEDAHGTSQNIICIIITITRPRLAFVRLALRFIIECVNFGGFLEITSWQFSINDQHHGNPHHNYHLSLANTKTTVQKLCFSNVSKKVTTFSANLSSGRRPPTVFWPNLKNSILIIYLSWYSF